jgi:hypothetical protein
MTPADTRCVMTQIVMPMHTNGVAGVMFFAQADARRRAAGRAEHKEPS